MKKIALIACVLLAGCKTAAPNVRVETVEVLREVTKPCPGVRPVRPASVGALPTDLVALVAVLGAKLAEYSAPGKFADQADAIFDRCPLEPVATPVAPEQ